MTKKTFINPLTRSSELSLNLPPDAEKGNDTSANPVVATTKAKSPKNKEKAFEETHQRFTSWVDKKLKRQFDELAAKKGVSKSALLNEAITALLHKQHRKPYTKRQSTD